MHNVYFVGILQYQLARNGCKASHTYNHKKPYSRLVKRVERRRDLLNFQAGAYAFCSSSGEMDTVFSEAIQTQLHRFYVLNQ